MQYKISKRCIKLELFNMFLPFKVTIHLKDSLKTLSTPVTLRKFSVWFEMKVKFLRFWVWVSRPTLIGHLVPFFRNNSQGNWENDCNFNYTYSPHLLFLTPFKPYKTRVHSIHLPFRQPHKSQVYELAQLVTFKTQHCDQIQSYGFWIGLHLKLQLNMSFCYTNPPFSDKSCQPQVILH